MMSHTNNTTLQTEISRWDNFIGGLPQGNLAVLTTSTNVDRTNLETNITQILALNIAKNIEEKQNLSIALFNFDREWSHIKRFEESQTFLYSPYRNEIQRLCAEVRQLKVEHEKLSLVAIDGLQYLMSGSNYDNHYQRLYEVSNSLKSLANELNITIIACTPLNTQLNSKVFDMVKINASLIVSLNEKAPLNEYKKTFVLLYINKTVSGYPGLMHLYYNRRQMRFENN